ncbi:uncharacterized protein BJ171DRAFT_17480 [Polychytrium aggregatum]|uniref:uncharacterized protein n=1 Tax=Polychytrium aggregatum TaxID=110093 RepID=UPI0022FEDEFB|nr:uncharacterized protein BJ171DRAFT_17480 [Polychytrium aggregatum]KAI9206688.1 hypothetical protein BJ171DRAFT_17480 [Polychytrium aggregatum]
MEGRAARAGKVQNKTPAALQITAEQILREATERTEGEFKQPRQKITDKEELDEFKLKKRKTFEDAIRRNRTSVGAWLKYAAWEESMNEMERARSVYERALEVDHRNQALWLKYSEMEIKWKNINRARNIFDRAVALLPRVDLFWYKYTYMEEMLDNPAGARQVFERWMAWEPSEEGWMAYVKMEKRYGEEERARQIFQRFVSVHPEPKNWLKWAKFEEQSGHVDTAREIYTQCLSTLGEDFVDQNFFVSFAKFEIRVKEIERARVIYKYALEKYTTKGTFENLQNSYTQFEKQYGVREGIEDVVISKRRLKYEEEIAANPKNYDTWFDYIRLEETQGDHPKIREIFERAIAEVPPVLEKRFWRRYIYLWLFYAVWEESQAKDAERAGQVYNQCLRIIPHKTFTFAKVWLLYARFLVRQKNLEQARKTLGMAIGMAPKERLFKGYIELEIQLREFDRVRLIYEKYLAWNQSNCYAWVKFAELETGVGDSERARGIFEIAVAQPELDMPEVLWKAYIDFEIGEQEWENARSLYQRLLQRTDHVKVWISFANFEFQALDNGDEAERAVKARETFETAYQNLKRKEMKDERVVLLEALKEFETSHGNASTLSKVEARMPRAVKKRRKLQDEFGQSAGWEEYFDYIFPDDETDKPNLKLLAMAHEWKTKMAQLQSNDDDDDDDDDNDDDDDDDEEEEDDDDETAGNGE